MKDPVLASRVFGVYLALSGLGFGLAPALATRLVGLREPTEVWIRVVGILTTILGMYFLYCARPEQRRFFQATVIARGMFFTGVTALVAAGLAPPIFIGFGLVDVLGAAWMQYALHATRGAQRAT